MNPYKSATYMGSANSLCQCPQDRGREVAFAGRSNVGKSSVINTLSGQNKLARTSKIPGRTRLLNYFRITDAMRLVDLPGYGYARVSESTRQHWGRLMQEYFSSRRSLVGLVLVMDIRNPMKPSDQQMLLWCSSAHLPVCILLNKADKLSRGAQASVLRQVQRQMPDNMNCSIQLFSALRGVGRDQLREKLDEWFDI